MSLSGVDAFMNVQMNVHLWLKADSIATVDQCPLYLQKQTLLAAVINVCS
jgi:hypothetical protein